MLKYLLVMIFYDVKYIVAVDYDLSMNLLIIVTARASHSLFANFLTFLRIPSLVYFYQDHRSRDVREPFCRRFSCEVQEQPYFAINQDHTRLSFECVMT